MGVLFNFAEVGFEYLLDIISRFNFFPEIYYDYYKKIIGVANLPIPPPSLL